MRDWRFLWSLVGRERRFMLGGTLVGLAAAVATVGLMTVGGGLLAFCTLSGLATPGLWNPSVGRLSAGIRFFAIGRTLGRYGERLLTHDATLRILARLRRSFFLRLAPLAPGGLGRARRGDLLERVVADVDTLTGFYIRVASPLGWSLALVAVLAGFLLWVQPSVAGAATVSLLVATVGLPWLGGRLGRGQSQAVALASQRLRARLLEALQGRAELWVYGAAEARLADLEREGRALVGAQERFAAQVALLQALAIVVAGLGLTAVLLLGANAAAASGPAPTLLAAAVLAVMTAFEVVAPLAAASPERERVRAATARLRSVLEASPPTPEPDSPVALTADTTLQLEGVGYRYSQDARRPALEPTDLTVEAGQHLAVVGPSGAGKSTLVHLLTRLRDPTEGRVLLGGVDLRDLAEADLRGRVVAVEQQPHLFGGTLRQNLQLGRPEATDDELREVLDVVGLPLDAEGLPNGLDTRLSGTGDPEGAGIARPLSGGEARRVALARALLREPTVLLLDEPVEDLDAASARALLSALRRTMQGRTLVLVTHSRVALERVDRVVLLEAGRVVEQGSHTALLDAGGRYAERWARIG